MEIAQSEDQFALGPDNKPARVTDYKLIFPHDFTKISKPELFFSTDENYMQTSFKIASGQILADISILRKQKNREGNMEHAILEVNDDTGFYQAKSVLTGESGIGFQVVPNLTVNDYLHTHTVYKGEDERSADLFSAFDLWKMGAQGAERYWLVGKKVVWTLVNLYGQRYAPYIKDACCKMANKYNRGNSYNENLSNLIECVNKCEYRLYRSDNSTDYSLVS
jgi:hypothetical protein